MMPALSPEPLLVVEDNNADFRMLKRLIRQMDVQSPIYRCKTGDEALDLLYQRGPYHETTPRLQPGIVLLDLNLPGLDGRMLLGQLKQDPTLKKIPVVVFTTSSAPNDIEYCYQQGANSYLVKPVHLQELERTVRALVDYWLGVNISVGGRQA
jgi:CheY-like chemotaxis protein